MTGADFIKGQMVRLAYFDGFSEGIDGLRAICFVIRNRVNAGWWGGNWIDVLTHHRDYSAYVEPYPDELPDPRVYSVQCLLQEVDGIFNGTAKDDVTVPAQPSFQNGIYRPALYYAKLDAITDENFLENISRKPNLHPRVAQVGQIFFFG